MNLHDQPLAAAPAHPIPAAIDEALQAARQRADQYAWSAHCASHAGEAHEALMWQRLAIEAAQAGARLACLWARFAAAGDGFELADSRGARYAVLLPDASEPGRYRYQVFDAAGLAQHRAFDSAACALAAAIEEGFSVCAAGALERLAASGAWLAAVCAQRPARP